MGSPCWLNHAAGKATCMAVVRLRNQGPSEEPASLAAAWLLTPRLRSFAPRRAQLFSRRQMRVSFGKRA